MVTPTQPDRRSFLRLAASAGAVIGLAPVVPAEEAKPEVVKPSNDDPPVTQAERDASHRAANSPANLELRAMIHRLKSAQEMIDRFVEQDHGEGCSCHFCDYGKNSRSFAQFIYDTLWVASWDLSGTINVLENHTFMTEAERQQFIAELPAMRAKYDGGA